MVLTETTLPPLKLVSVVVEVVLLKLSSSQVAPSDLSFQVTKLRVCAVFELEVLGAGFGGLACEAEARHRYCFSGVVDGGGGVGGVKFCRVFWFSSVSQEL